MRRQRDAAVSARLGNPERRVRIAIAPSDGDIDTRSVQGTEDSRSGAIERSSRDPHEGDYLAAVITPLGVRPIRDEDDLQAARAMRERAVDTGEPAMIFGVAKAVPQASKTGEVPWVSENGVASPDGLGLFNLRNAEIG